MVPMSTDKEKEREKEEDRDREGKSVWIGFIYSLSVQLEA
jgi:hypothetical protein